MKYIDAEKLRAEIERRIDLICTTEGVVQRDRLQEYETLRDVEDFITSLQQEQPEVDLKKEIKEWADLMVGASFPEQDGDFISEEDYRDVIKQTALHFYELSRLNARKED